MKYRNSLTLSLGLLLLAPAMVIAEPKRDQEPTPPKVITDLLPGAKCNKSITVTVDGCNTVGGKDQPISCAAARVTDGNSYPIANLFACSAKALEAGLIAAQKTACPKGDNGLPSEWKACQPPVYSYVEGKDTENAGHCGVKCNGDKALTLGIKQYGLCLTQVATAAIVNDTFVSCIGVSGTQEVACGSNIGAGIFSDAVLFHSYISAMALVDDTVVQPPVEAIASGSPEPQPSDPAVAVDAPSASPSADASSVAVDAPSAPPSAEASSVPVYAPSSPPVAF